MQSKLLVALFAALALTACQKAEEAAAPAMEEAKEAPAPLRIRLPPLQVLLPMQPAPPPKRQVKPPPPRLTQPRMQPPRLLRLPPTPRRKRPTRPRTPPSNLPQHAVQAARFSWPFFYWAPTNRRGFRRVLRGTQHAPPPPDQVIHKGVHDRDDQQAEEG